MPIDDQNINVTFNITADTTKVDKLKGSVKEVGELSVTATKKAEEGFKKIEAAQVAVKDATDKHIASVQKLNSGFNLVKATEVQLTAEIKKRTAALRVLNTAYLKLLETSKNDSKEGRKILAQKKAAIKAEARELTILRNKYREITASKIKNEAELEKAVDHRFESYEEIN